MLESFGGSDTDEGQVKLYSIKVEKYLYRKMQTDKQMAFTTEAKRRKAMNDKRRAQQQVEASRKSAKKGNEDEEEGQITRKASKPLSSSGPKRDEDDPVTFCKIMVSAHIMRRGSGSMTE